MTNMSQIIGGSRNWKNKQRQRLKDKKRKTEIYRGWTNFDHKLRALALTISTEHKAFTTTLNSLLEETELEPDSDQAQI